MNNTVNNVLMMSWRMPMRVGLWPMAGENVP